MGIRIANIDDLLKLNKLDKHISEEELLNSINLKRVYLIEENSILVGWLRYNLFWDNTPFMNLLYILDEYRGKGYGKSLVLYWECEMKKLGYDYLLTSTASNEDAKGFYEKLGYKNIGGFNYKDDPYELIYSKNLIK